MSGNELFHKELECIQGYKRGYSLSKTLDDIRNFDRKLDYKWDMHTEIPGDGIVPPWIGAFKSAGFAQSLRG